jgi:AbrB family looped-hinge helix DNA binding protein
MTKPSGFSETDPPFLEPALSVQGNLGSDGRVLIPAALREAAGIKRGEKVILKVEDGRIVLSSWKAEIRKLQGMFAHLKKPGENIVDEFIAGRRAEAARESED